MTVRTPTIDELLSNNPELWYAVAGLIRGVLGEKSPEQTLDEWDEARRVSERRNDFV